MADLADVFVAISGGWGTLDELAEILTWKQLDLIHQPVFIINESRFFDHLLGQLDLMVAEGFLKQECRDFLQVVEPSPIRDIVQLCYVLPKPSLQLLPRRVYENMSKHPNFNSMYATNHHMNWSFCKFFWECHSEMPELDIRELEEICSTY